MQQTARQTFSPAWLLSRYRGPLPILFSLSPFCLTGFRRAQPVKSMILPASFLLHLLLHIQIHMHRIGKILHILQLLHRNVTCRSI